MNERINCIDIQNIIYEQCQLDRPVYNDAYAVAQKSPVMKLPNRDERTVDHAYDAPSSFSFGVEEVAGLRLAMNSDTAVQYPDCTHVSSRVEIDKTLERR